MSGFFCAANGTETNIFLVVNHSVPLTTDCLGLTRRATFKGELAGKPGHRVHAVEVNPGVQK